MVKLITFIKEEEFNLLLKAEKDRKYKLIYLLAFGSGLRISEIIGYKRKDGKEISPLTPEQIDLQAKTIKIIGGKGMKDRIVPLFPNFKEEYLKLLPLSIPRSTVQHHFKSLGKKVLGKDLHFHQLRHGFGIMATKRGIPMPFLQQAMGHSRLDTTGIYTASSPDDMVKGFQKAWGEI
jgi:integrase/recombinase XerD